MTIANKLKGPKHPQLNTLVEIHQTFKDKFAKFFKFFKLKNLKSLVFKLKVDFQANINKDDIMLSKNNKLTIFMNNCFIKRYLKLM